MATSQAVPIKLPIPPTAPKQRKRSVADRALAAINDEDIDDPTSLDVHIRWVVESGSIVQKGEKIAVLFYCFHGTPPPSSSAASSSSSSGGTTIIRARKKKRWAANTQFNNLNAAASSSNKSSTATLPSNDNYVTLEVRAPSHGFLRILYNKSFANNAVDYTEDIKSVINLILAAIEPCEHPAVVGFLCAVCGADTRAILKGSCNERLENDDTDSKPRKESPIPRKESPIPRKHNVQAEQRQHNEGEKIKKKKPVDKKQQKIIEKQKKLAASIASSSAEFDSDDELAEELANFDVDAAVSSHAKNNDGWISTRGTKQPAVNQPVAPKPTKPKQPAAQPTQMRSLSSLLSGAKATQKLQQTPDKQKQSPKQQQLRPMVSHHQRRMAAISDTNNKSCDDPKMSKMTVSGGVTITVSESEAKNISDASSKKLRSEKKLCLVLDLDHTLLHATDDYRAGRFVADEIIVDNEKKDGDDDEKKEEGDNIMPQQPSKPRTIPNPEKSRDVRSILLPIELSPADQQVYIQNKLQQQKQDTAHNFCLSPLPQQKQGVNPFIVMRHFIKLRPHLKEFFSQISSTYQLSVYTAGTRAYAEQVAIMICRHLVGATYDEEGLNTLRSKVREKDEEVRRYTAKIGRKKQLELAKAHWDGDDNDDEVQVIEKKEGDTKCTDINDTKKESSKTTSHKAKAASKTTAAKDNMFVSTEDGCISLSSSFSQKRSNDSSDNGEMHIPRKKKRVNFGSLLPPNPAESELAQKSIIVEEEELSDPSDERDRIRKELEEAEKLEIAAVELRRKMFGSRIVSRTDVGDLGKDVKSLKRVFPCGGVMAAILDDREDVWANANNNVTGRPGEPPDNLLLVKPYHWKPFQGYADVNNASGQDLSKKTDDKQSNAKPDEKESDSQLLWTADILRRLHERYYSTTLSEEEREKISVPSLLQSMRKETFLRYPQVKVVFSGLIPMSQQNKQLQVRPHVVRYAEELGAEVLPSISNEVTHIVAARDGSEKIRQARKGVPGCFIVHTSWLMECYWSIKRRDVRPYHMGPMPSTSSQQPVRQQPVAATKKKDKEDSLLLLGSDKEESDEDESEDDFAADLESEMMSQGM